MVRLSEMHDGDRVHMVHPLAGTDDGWGTVISVGSRYALVLLDNNKYGGFTKALPENIAQRKDA